MSIILDALRKSEAARRRHEQPGLLDAAAGAGPLLPVAPTRANRLPWVLAGLGLALAAGALWWALSRTPTVTQAPGAGDAIAEGAAPGDNGIDRAPGVPGAVGSAPFADADAVFDAQAAESRDAAREAAERAEQVARDAARDRGLLPSTPADLNRPPPTPPAPLTPRPVTPVAPADGNDAAASAPPPAQSAPPSAPPAPIRPAADAPPLRIADLDPGSRKQLPPLKLSLHLWNTDPRRRVVVLDGQRLTEGDLLGELVIERIERDAVLLAWRGNRLRLEAR
jgi:general secretion pathway protein B